MSSPQCTGSASPRERHFGNCGPRRQDNTTIRARKKEKRAPEQPRLTAAPEPALRSNLLSSASTDRAPASSPSSSASRAESSSWPSAPPSCAPRASVFCVPACLQLCLCPKNCLFPVLIEIVAIVQRHRYRNREFMQTKACETAVARSDWLSGSSYRGAASTSVAPTRPQSCSTRDRPRLRWRT